MLERAAGYAEAKPFSHCVIDDFWQPEDELRSVLAEWPDPAHMMFKVCETSIKAYLADWEQFGPATKAVIEKLNSRAFIEELERLTGLDHLLPDPLLTGGGLHEIPTGGFLRMHVDFNWHKRLRAARKVNLLLYLNEDWSSNGDLILSKDGFAFDRIVAPIFNRCVIFNTTDASWHGHPGPLAGRRSRKSIALYYYRPEPEPKERHSTIYRMPAELAA